MTSARGWTAVVFPWNVGRSTITTVGESHVILRGRSAQSPHIGCVQHVQVNLQRLYPEALSPRPARSGDAGHDLSTRVDHVLGPGERAALPTGIALEIPSGYAGLVLPRSGHARRSGVTVVNGPGLIDSGYRGEVEVLLINHGSDPVIFKKGDRIAQLVIVAVPQIEFNEVDVLGDSERGAGGFGSTGQ